jgi:hypothetical protein
MESFWRNSGAISFKYGDDVRFLWTRMYSSHVFPVISALYCITYYKWRWPITILYAFMKTYVFITLNVTCHFYSDFIYLSFWKFSSFIEHLANNCTTWWQITKYCKSYSCLQGLYDQEAMETALLIKSLKQNISAILYFKQTENVLSYDPVILTEEFLWLSSSQCLGNTICLTLTAGGWQLTYL